MEESQAIVSVLRVLGKDTLQMRAWCPLTQGRLTIYATPCGISCEPEARTHIVDWCEVHSDAERLKMVTYDFIRDEYGRMLVDLCDIHSGEALTSYLLSVGAATERPRHILDTLGHMLSAGEVEDADW